jgi:hypothetical protein
LSLRVRNWEKFQHYKARRPPWIKLHRSLLEDRAFLALPLAAQALAPRLWLLASETDDGSLPSDPGELAFRLRCSESELIPAANALISSKFLAGSLDVASAALSPCSRGAVPETEVETETEGEEKQISSPSAPLLFPAPAPVPTPVEAVMAYWSDRTNTTPRVESSVVAIRRRIKQRLEDGFSEQDLRDCVDYALRDEFYVEKGYAKNPHVLFKNAPRVEDLLRRSKAPPPPNRGQPVAARNDQTVTSWAQKIREGTRD